MSLDHLKTVTNDVNLILPYLSIRDFISLYQNQLMHGFIMLPPCQPRAFAWLDRLAGSLAIKDAIIIPTSLVVYVITNLQGINGRIPFPSQLLPQCLSRHTL